MATQNDQSAGASRDQARARLRILTRAALFATAGATVGIGIVVAHEHPGKSGASTTSSGRTSGAATGTSGSTGARGSAGSTGSTGDSGNSGNTGSSGASSSSPTISSQSPAVTSGGTSR